MSKYINADKLIDEIERRIESWTIRGKHSPAGQGRDTCDSRVTELSDLLSFITSLQQEQPESICPRCVYRNKTDDICEYPYGGRDCLINKNGVYKCNGFEEVEQQDQPHKSFCVENCKGYRDTGGKCFFGFDCSVKKAQEQEVDVEKALDEYYKIVDWGPSEAIEYDTHKDIARHFYELGLNAKKEKSL